MNRSHLLRLAIPLAATLTLMGCADDDETAPGPDAQPATDAVAVTVDLELTVVPVEGGPVSYVFVDADSGEEVVEGPLTGGPRQTFTEQLPPGTYTLEIHSAVDIGDGTSGEGDEFSAMPCDPDIEVAGTAVEVIATAGTQCAVETTEVDA
jgi:hypothetical protein